MAKFKGPLGKRVANPKGGTIVFKDEYYETSDKAQIGVLQKAIGVEEVKAPKKAADK